MCGGWQDRNKCFHSHNIYMTIELAVQTLIWCLGPFISLQSTGFGALIKMIKINQSINTWSNYFNCLNIALASSFSVPGEAWLWRSLFWTFLRKPGSLHFPYVFQMKSVNEQMGWRADEFIQSSTFI